DSTKIEKEMPNNNTKAKESPLITKKEVQIRHQMMKEEVTEINDITTKMKK
ncbi:8207_t:CDS:1, partial [Gigaspora margarita]